MDAQGEGAEPSRDLSDESGFALEHVRQAAVEAGIDASFVDSAWTEAQVGIRPSGPALDKRITAFLGREDRAIVRSRVMEARPEEVLDAILEVATSDRCRLRPLDWVGGHPLDGGALVFKPEPHDYTTSIGKAAMWADFKELVFHIAELEEDRTDVRVRCSLEHSRKLHFRVGLPLSGSLSGGSGVALAALVGALGVAPPFILGVGLAGLATGWWGGVRGYRALYGLALLRGTEGIDELLQQIAVHVRTRRRRGETVRPQISSSAPSSPTRQDTA